MTKAELEQLRFLKSEIRLLEEEIYTMKLPMTIDSVTGSDSEFPYTKHKITIRGIDTSKLEKMNMRLVKKVAELVKEMDKLNTYIDSIVDSEIRQIMIMRYRNGCTWRQIGFKLGYDQSTVRKKHDIFIK